MTDAPQTLPSTKNAEVQLEPKPSLIFGVVGAVDMRCEAWIGGTPRSPNWTVAFDCSPSRGAAPMWYVADERENPQRGMAPEHLISHESGVIEMILAADETLDDEEALLATVRPVGAYYWRPSGGNEEN